MNNWLSNVYVDRSDNGKKKNKFTKYISRIIKKENDQTKLTKILK